MQTYFKCADGFEARADEVLIKACRKRVTDMHHEVKVQAVVTYYGSKLGQRISKLEARQVTLTRSQYIEVQEEA